MVSRLGVRWRFWVVLLGVFCWVGGGFVGGGLGGFGSAEATVLPAWDLAELVAHSPWVVVATVQRQGTQVDPTDGSIYTITVLTVEQYVVGEGEAELKIRQRGGAAGGLRQYVPGNAVLVPGERWVLFLEPGQGPFKVVVGMALGAYQITEPDPSAEIPTTNPTETTTTKIPIIRRAPGAVTVAANPDPSGLTKPSAVPSISLESCNGLTLEQFLSQIRLTAAAQERQP